MTIDVLASWKAISIHAPREGGDCAGRFLLLLRRISIHAPREGGDMAQDAATAEYLEFQSTPPARGATAKSEMHRLHG